MDNRHFSYITKLRKGKALSTSVLFFNFVMLSQWQSSHKDILVTVGYRPAMKVKKNLKIFLYLGYLLA
jgi:hypothetical protein